MSIVATSIVSIPKTDYNWFVTFIEFEEEPKIKEEINKYFNKLGEEVGPKVLAVRGYDKQKFRESVFEASSLYDEKWHEKIAETSIIITDKNPQIALSDPKEMSKSKIIVFPLSRIYESQGTIQNFLHDLVGALSTENIIKARENIPIEKDKQKESEVSAFKKCWIWLRKYTEMKPSFFGFSLDLGALLDDYVLKPDI